ncbi:hypothetical protein OG524_04165 [Streptomyces sp. NBC_01520]
MDRNTQSPLGEDFRVIAPAGPAGSVLVSVTTSGGTSNPLAYQRVAPPAI